MPEANPNTALWDKVQTTDPKFVKPITGKSYNGNSPSPHYLVRKATETFGPCGIGWGFSIENECLLDGAVLDSNGLTEKISHARVRVWYKWHGDTGSVEHVGQTMFCGKRRNGTVFTDEDAPKKSVTDALTKALSMIGFAGDIFLGRWDDSRYVAGLEAAQTAEAAKQPAPQPAIVPQQKAAFNPEEWAASVAEAKSYPDTHSWDECYAWWRENLPRLEAIKERDNILYAEIYRKFMAKKSG